MKKALITGVFICILALVGLPAQAFEIEHAVKGSVGVGDRKSMAMDFAWQQTYGALLDGAYFELRPFTAIGGLLWIDIDGNDHFWATSKTWRKSSHTAWGFFGALGLRLAYKGENWQPFVALSVGPSYISDSDFVERNLGGHFIFNDRAALGARFGGRMQHELSFQFTHYSNAGIYTHNRGYNTYSLSYAYCF